ncbi:unnamed protein product [Camellia sinensis]
MAARLTSIVTSLTSQSTVVNESNYEELDVLLAERSGASLEPKHVSTQSLLLDNIIAQPFARLYLPYELTPLVGIYVT